MDWQPAEQGPRWQPAEQGPKDGMRVLYYDAAQHRIFIGSCWWMQPDSTTWYDDELRVIDPPTYWHPLPLKPDPPVAARASEEEE